MELELGLAPPNARPPAGERAGAGAFVVDGKRGFEDAFGAAGKATLPLFVRDDAGGDDGRGGGGDDGEMSNNKRKRLVGWPPVKSAHKRAGGGAAGYVKVKMEGVAIGRKVDVSLHRSYDELLRTLDRMFPSANPGAGADAEEEEVSQHGQRRRRHPYVVTYEDGDGDWLLVGDVPWEAFAKSVKRLKILASRS
ncbi:hypothetical protein ACP70R_041787 [Stipagrostis hirtigluma subsp. patula]